MPASVCFRFVFLAYMREHSTPLKLLVEKCLFKIFIFFFIFSISTFTCVAVDVCVCDCRHIFPSMYQHDNRLMYMFMLQRVPSTNMDYCRVGVFFFCLHNNNNNIISAEYRLVRNWPRQKQTNRKSIAA